MDGTSPVKRNDGVFTSPVHHHPSSQPTSPPAPTSDHNVKSPAIGYDAEADSRTLDRGEWMRNQYASWHVYGAKPERNYINSNAPPMASTPYQPLVTADMMRNFYVPQDKTPFGFHRPEDFPSPLAPERKVRAKTTGAFRNRYTFEPVVSHVVPEHRTGSSRALVAGPRQFKNSTTQDFEIRTLQPSHASPQHQPKVIPAMYIKTEPGTDDFLKHIQGKSHPSSFAQGKKMVWYSSRSEAQVRSMLQIQDHRIRAHRWLLELCGVDIPLSNAFWWTGDGLRLLEVVKQPARLSFKEKVFDDGKVLTIIEAPEQRVQD